MILDWHKNEKNNLYPVRASFVTSMNGCFAGIDETSKSITNSDDRHYFLQLRNNADIIIVGAETIRKEQYQMPKKNSILILTNSGKFMSPLYKDIIGEKICLKKIIICTQNKNFINSKIGKIIPKKNIIQIPTEEIITELRKRGFKKILYEGGLQLIYETIKNKNLDEFFLTLIPRYIKCQHKNKINFFAEFSIMESLTMKKISILKLKIS